MCLLWQKKIGHHFGERTIKTIFEFCNHSKGKKTTRLFSCIPTIHELKQHNIGLDFSENIRNQLEELGYLSSHPVFSIPTVDG